MIEGDPRAMDPITRVTRAMWLPVSSSGVCDAPDVASHIM